MSLDTSTKVANLQALSVLFGQGVRTAAPYYPNLCVEKTSDGEKETYGIPGAVSGMREWLGDRVFNMLAAAHFDVVNKHFEWSHAIDRDHYEDDRFGMYDAAFRDGGAECANYPDEIFFDMLVAGSATQCWDNQYFFDTDHAWGDSGTMSNALTYDASSHTAVTSAEFKAAYQYARRTMLAYRNDKGKLLNRPTRRTDGVNLVALCPLALQDAAAEAVQATILNNTSNVLLDRPTVVGTAYLTSGVSFYLIDLSDSVRPMIFQKRQPLKPIQWKGLDDREGKDIKGFTDSRWNFGYYGWWKAIKVTFN